MRIVGITGPTGAGKTTALAAAQALGGAVIDCDAVYHRLLETDGAMVDSIGERFPGTVRAGRLDRQALGGLVFADPRALEALNGLTHPRVAGEVERLLAAAERDGAKLAVIDAVGLFESGLHRLCGLTLCVTAPREDRIRRVMLRDGISRQRAQARVDAQRGEEYYRARCDRTLVNDFSHSRDFYRRCEEFFKEVIQMPDVDLRDQLFYKQKNLGDILDERETELSRDYCAKYMAYLDAARTERLAVTKAVELAEKYGFHAYDRNAPLKAGDKIYRNVRGKMLLLAVVGRDSLGEGANICAAHIDSPRLDLKQVPLYEQNEICYFKTHYYGGIRKYQWVAMPLELHGVVALRDGSTVTVSIGRDESDPVFVISDLLPHLAAKQSEQPLAKAIPGEKLNIIMGSLPLRDDKGADRVKLAVMKLLNEKYGITEEDFLSAEIEAVPGLPVRDAGLDRSLIAGYGHDDRVCAFAELQAIYETEDPRKTAVCILADKEEIGSVGVSGMVSQAFECFMGDLCAAQGVRLDHCFEKSFCVSADVTNAFDPTWPEVSEIRNNSKLNYGVAIAKYTGRGGKSGSNDAAAEVMGKIRRIFGENGVTWQYAELGRVDEGGGGTVACYMGNRNIDTVDAGVPVLSMHSPYELVAKYDCYMTYKAMKAVYASR